MLKCFFGYSDIPELPKLLIHYCKKKLRLQGEDFSEPYMELQGSDGIC